MRVHRERRGCRHDHAHREGTAEQLRHRLRRHLRRAGNARHLHDHRLDLRSHRRAVDGEHRGGVPGRIGRLTPPNWPHAPGPSTERPSLTRPPSASTRTMHVRVVVDLHASCGCARQAR
ncbi:hypothetical protein ACFPRL_13145 [Pseudoclavibacter helvolus]